MSCNTLFLRLEGALQAWGDNQSKFVVRRTAPAPTKSGVIGLLLAALGVGRDEAPGWLPRLRELEFGVRSDRPGVRWWDYHTVGGGEGVSLRKADGGTRDQALLSRREYLCDASFLAVLRGEPELINMLHAAVKKPRWTLYLGRKACPPGRPVLEREPLAATSSLMEALCEVPWRPRYQHSGEWPDGELDCYYDWVPTEAESHAPLDAEVWYDVPVCLNPPAHEPRFVLHETLTVGRDKDVARDDTCSQSRTLTPPRPRAGYQDSGYRKARFQRLYHDENLCVFCKSPATTVQHVTYRNAGGGEQQDDLRALCRLCHDAITMLEYGAGMGIERINPEDPGWRERIIAKREALINERSLETRRRRLEPTEVE